jgi:hypothetical protein
MIALAPWAKGPFELIVHAEEHLRKGDDFDRRIALISFDDSIEVAITTYLTLHPDLRNKRQYPKAKIEEWLKNFHTKLEFLKEELAARSTEWGVDRNHILWAHDHRNEQYHGGKKGTPEQDVLAIARSAALWIFAFLFDVAEVEAVVEVTVQKRPLLQIVPLRKEEFDIAIDAAIDPVILGDSIYDASDLLFSTDYDAYRDLAVRLLDEAEQAKREKIA